MDEAILESSGETYQAAEVNTLSDPKSQTWRCTGCDLKLHPCSFRPENKKVAYFAAYPRTDHEDCTADGVTRLIAAGEKKPISSLTQVRGLFPAAIRFPPEHDRELKPGQTPSTPVATKSRYYPPSYLASSEMVTLPHRQTATTIRTACRIHGVIPNPELRKRMPLEIDECTGSTYYDVFWQLENIREPHVPPRLAGYIFYASLRFTDRPNYDDPQVLELKLNCGHFQRGAGLLRPYRVFVEWGEWSEKDRRSFAARFEAQRKDVKNAYFLAKDEGRQRPSATLYVLGLQDASDPLTFRVDDRRKIALLLQVNGLYWDVKVPWSAIEQLPKPERCQLRGIPDVLKARTDLAPVVVPGPVSQTREVGEFNYSVPRAVTPSIQVSSPFTPQDTQGVRLSDQNETAVGRILGRLRKLIGLTQVWRSRLESTTQRSGSKRNGYSDRFSEFWAQT